MLSHRVIGGLRNLSGCGAAIRLNPFEWITSTSTCGVSASYDCAEFRCSSIGSLVLVLPPLRLQRVLAWAITFRCCRIYARVVESLVLWNASERASAQTSTPAYRDEAPQGLGLLASNVIVVTVVSCSHNTKTPVHSFTPRART